MKGIIKWMMASSVMVILFGVFFLNQALAVTEDFKVMANDASGNYYGSSISVSGDVLAVASVGPLGSVYVYRFDGANWVEEAKLTASDEVKGDYFGRSVSVSGDVIVVGAFYDQVEGKIQAGSAYVFRFDGANWVEEAKLTASDAEKYDTFGTSVAVSGEVIVVGYRCSAYVFRFDGANWAEEAKLIASDTAEDNNFGDKVSINGGIIAVGARRQNNFEGSAYVFRFDSAEWIEEAKLTASDAAQGDAFGCSLSTNGEVIVVGACDNDDLGEETGSAYVFRFDGASWVEEAKLIASDAAQGDVFGKSVSVSGEVIAIGASHTEDDDTKDSGSVYHYRFDGADWIEKDKLTASDAATYDYFGLSVSISGEVTTVSGNDAVYIFGSPCSVPKIVCGVISDKNAPRKDSFSIHLKAMTGLSEALIDLDSKTVTVNVGMLDLEIPGDQFVSVQNGAYSYYRSASDTKQILFIYFNPTNGIASLNCARTNLGEITNPISVVIKIDSACWQSTTEWREFSYPHGVIYRIP